MLSADWNDYNFIYIILSLQKVNLIMLLNLEKEGYTSVFYDTTTSIVESHLETKYPPNSVPHQVDCYCVRPVINWPTIENPRPVA